MELEGLAQLNTWSAAQLVFVTKSSTRPILPSVLRSYEGSSNASRGTRVYETKSHDSKWLL